MSALARIDCLSTVSRGAENSMSFKKAAWHFWKCEARASEGSARTEKKRFGSRVEIPDAETRGDNSQHGRTDS
jgi:hypothetical protein